MAGAAQRALSEPSRHEQSHPGPTGVGLPAIQRTSRLDVHAGDPGLIDTRMSRTWWGAPLAGPIKVMNKV